MDKKKIVFFLSSTICGVRIQRGASASYSIEGYDLDFLGTHVHGWNGYISCDQLNHVETDKKILKHWHIY